MGFVSKLCFLLKVVFFCHCSLPEMFCIELNPQNLKLQHGNPTSAQSPQLLLNLNVFLSEYKRLVVSCCLNVCKLKKTIYVTVFFFFSLNISIFYGLVVTCFFSCKLQQLGPVAKISRSQLCRAHGSFYPAPK